MLKPRTYVKQPAPAPPPRIHLDLNPATLVEILDCVAERVVKLQDAGQPIPHITSIALKMLHEATARP
jgi:hypothetical protein